MCVGKPDELAPCDCRMTQPKCVLWHAGKAGDFDMAMQLFAELPANKLKADVWTYTSMINACQTCGNQWKEGLAFFQEMEAKGKSCYASHQTQSEQDSIAFAEYQYSWLPACTQASCVQNICYVATIQHSSAKLKFACMLKHLLHSSCTVQAVYCWRQMCSCPLQECSQMRMHTHH